MDGRMAIPKILMVLLLLAWGWDNRRKPSLIFSEGRGWIPVSLSILVIAGFAGMGILAVANFSNFDWGDISCYLSSFRNSEGLFPGTNVISGRPLLAHHSEFLAIPVGWIFRLAPGPLVLQLIQAASALGAWALLRSWLVRRAADRMTGEWLAFGFALSPCLVAPLLKGFHPVALVVPILVWTATSFHDRRWRSFLASLVFLLLAKEIFIITALALGALSLVQRREAKWIAAPIAMGLLYGLFLRYLYFPWMLGDQVYYYASTLGDIGGILRRLFAWNSPLYALKLLLWGGAFYVLRSPYALMAVPSALLNLSLEGSYSDPHLHYIVDPSFWIFFAGAAGFLAKTSAAAPLAGTAAASGPAPRLRLASWLVCLFLMNAISRENVPLYLDHKYGDSYRRALALLPEDSTVSIGVALEDHLWKMKQYYWVKFGRIHWLEHDSQHYCHKGDYALMLKVHIPGGTDGFDWEEQQNIRRCREALERNPGYETVWQDSVLVLFRKK